MIHQTSNSNSSSVQLLSVHEEPGHGITADFSFGGGQPSVRVWLGSAKWMRQLGVDLSGDSESGSESEGRGREGASVVLVAVGAIDSTVESTVDTIVDSTVESMNTNTNTTTTMTTSSTAPTTTQTKSPVLAARFWLQDAPRPEARATVAWLHAHGLEVFILSGDTEASAAALARHVGIRPDCVLAGVAPAQKAEFVRELQRAGRRRGGDKRSDKRWLWRWRSRPSVSDPEIGGDSCGAHCIDRASDGDRNDSGDRVPLLNNDNNDSGDRVPLLHNNSNNTDCQTTPSHSHSLITLKSTVAMVGDGVNDAAALTQADLGISVASATPLASHTSAVHLLYPGLAPLPTLFRLARLATRTIRFNYLWALGYNALVMPLAAGALVTRGVEMGMQAAAGAMVLSSVSVVLMSLSLYLYPL